MRAVETHSFLYTCFPSVSRMKCRLSYLPFSWVLANTCAVPCRDNVIGYIACGLLQSAFEDPDRKLQSCSRCSHCEFFLITRTIFIMLELVNAIIWSCTVTKFSDQKTGNFIIVNLFVKQWSGVSTCIKIKKTKAKQVENQTFNQTFSHLLWWTIRTYIANNSIYQGGKERR